MGKSGTFLLSIGEAESFSRIWSDVFLFVPCICAVGVGFWRVDVCGIFFGTVDLICPLWSRERFLQVGWVLGRSPDLDGV